MRTLFCLLFDDFETLDAFGPVEMFGQLKESVNIRFISLEGGTAASIHGVSCCTDSPPASVQEGSILLIPGGFGTRREVSNPLMIDLIEKLSRQCEYVLTVCTGSALLARTGLLDGLRATSNKRSLKWVMEQGPKVLWQGSARWVESGKYYTSSGVTAGIDMSLGFMSSLFGEEKAWDICSFTEYIWNTDKNSDPFSVPL